MREKAFTVAFHTIQPLRNDFAGDWTQSSIVSHVIDVYTETQQHRPFLGRSLHVPFSDGAIEK